MLNRGAQQLVHCNIWKSFATGKHRFDIYCYAMSAIEYILWTSYLFFFFFFFFFFFKAAIYTKEESKVTALCSIGPIMSDNVPLRIQESCIDYYMVDVFSCVREATNVGTRLRHQLVMYVTRASEDSGRLNILRVCLSRPVGRSVSLTSIVLVYVSIY